MRDNCCQRFGGRLTIWQKLRSVISLHNSPREIALGVAIGAFIGIMPLYGFHTIMVILAALLIRPANKVAILLGTNVSLPPTVPFITWAGYSLGRLVLKSNYPALDLSAFRQFNPKGFLRYYYPLFIGSLIEGLICGLIIYFLTLWFIIRHRAKKACRHDT
jgi:uncharacterized protein (TIGR03546 family)